MDQNNKLESGFKIVNLLLLESNFVRISNVIFDNNVHNDVNINIEVSPNQNGVSVIETVTLKQTINEVEQVSIMVKMVGIFEKIGDAEIDLDSFGKVNGAAIIFPYIREHISSLSTKSGIGAIFLNPVNFTKNN